MKWVKSITNFFGSDEGSVFRDLSFLLLAFGTLFFQTLGRLPLIDPDEGRYIEIPREMIAAGDFITPMLNQVKYFEKPPLHYWLNAASLTLFGETEFAARFAGTLCGVLTVLITYHLGRELFGRRSALFASTVLGSATGFLVLSRINFTDTTLTFCLSASLSFFALASRQRERKKALHYYLFYLFMALAVLAKGLIGIVLPAGVILLYLLLTRRWSLLCEMRIVTGGALFLLVSAPWFVLVTLRNPEFPQFFFIHEHFQRFLTKVHHRYQPPWFFLPVLAGLMLPWSPLIPAALLKGWRERASRPQTLFLILWGGVIFAFFSFSGSKLIPYILPVLPPLAILIGEWFTNCSGKALYRHAQATSLLLVLVTIAAVGYPLLALHAEIGIARGGVIGGALLCQGIAVALAGRTREPARLFVTLAATAFIFGLFAPALVYGPIAVNNSSREFARLINLDAGPGARIACLSGYEQGIAFYTHRRVMVVGDPDELEFGKNQGDQSAWFPDRDSFGRLWDSSAPLFAVIKNRDLPAFRRGGARQVVLVEQIGTRSLISNRPLAKKLP